jgi:rhomboid protease GluP
MTQRPKSAILCPNCRKLISRDEPRCPHCGISQPSSWLKQLTGGRVLENPYLLLRWIVALNIAMYALSLLMNPRALQLSLNPFAMLSPANDSLFLLGATGTIPIDRFHRWWSLMAANYLHGGLLHILFNMLALRQIAPLVFHEFGVHRTLILYTLSGVGGFGVSYLVGVPFTIGASAAVCGLIGAILYFGKRRGGTYGQAIVKQIGGWVFGLFIFGILVPGINNWGHGGGLAAGAALAFALGYQERGAASGWQRWLAVGCVIATLTTLAWAAGTGLYYRFLA